MKSWEVNIVEFGVGCRAIAGVVGHDVAMVIGGSSKNGVIEIFARREVLVPT